MEKQYLSDLISEDEISLWRPGQNILITSPTGSGKSSFVLKNLLPFAAKRRKHICYLCNRKILAEQLTVTAPVKLREFFGDCDDVSEDLLQFLHIITYQYCESGHGIPEALLKKMGIEADDILYYVYDECHYFLSDALFNSGTNLWASAIIRSDPGYRARLSVFLTATPEPFKFFFAAFYSKSKSILNNLNLEICTAVAALTLKDGSRDWDEVDKTIDAYCETTLYDKAVELHQAACGALEVKRYPKVPLKTNFHLFVPNYFHEYGEVFERIKATPSDEKWLVFVSRERDGIELKAMLKQVGIRSALLSRAAINRNKSERNIFNKIAHTGKFSCRVLIATELLDCGVSIMDLAVKHIVISHSKKATFLQMLGRRRTQAGDTVQLYLRYHSPNEIRGHIWQLNVKLRLLIRFSLLNETYFIRLKNNRTSDPYSNGKDEYKDKYEDEDEDEDEDEYEYDVLSPSSKNAVIRNIVRDKNAALICSKRVETGRRSPLEIERYASGKGKILEEYSYSSTALVALLYEISEYTDAMKTYRETKDPCFYLKRQLGWLGKSYDETCWLTYTTSRKALMDYLTSREGEWIPKGMQKEFSERCMKLLLELPVPPIRLKKDAPRFQDPTKELYPGLNRLNKALEEVNVPYRLIAKQKYMPDRMTCWCVVGASDHDMRCLQ